MVRRNRNGRFNKSNGSGGRNDVITITTEGLGLRPTPRSAKGERDAALLADGGPAGHGEVAAAGGDCAEAVRLADLIPTKQLGRKDQNGQTVMHHAAARGCTKCLQVMLRRRMCPDLKEDKLQQTPLHLAAKGNHLEFAELLVTAGADVTIGDVSGYLPVHLMEHRDNTIELLALLAPHLGAADSRGADGNTPLYDASKAGRVENVEYLLRLGADAGVAEGRFGWTPLHVAARWDHAHVAGLLVDVGGAGVDARDAAGKTPLVTAVLARAVAAAAALVARGADCAAVDNLGSCPLHYLSSGGDPTMLPALLRGEGAGGALGLLNRSGKTPLMTAAVHNTPATVRALLDAGADPDLVNGKGQTALFMAAMSGKGENAQVLAGAQADPDLLTFDDGDPSAKLASLHACVRKGLFGATRELIQSGADPMLRGGPNGDTPFHMAVKASNLEMLEFLLEEADERADLDALNDDGMTALHEVMDKSDRLEIGLARALLEAGADVNRINGRHSTPLHFLVALHGNREGAPEAIRLLADHGADLLFPEGENGAGLTPLHLACKMEMSAAVAAMLDAGADVDALDKYLVSPVNTAALVGSTELIRLLHGRGADLLLADANRDTPLHQASLRLVPDAVALLLELGGGAAVNQGNREGFTPLAYALQSATNHEGEKSCKFWSATQYLATEEERRERIPRLREVMRLLQAAGGTVTPDEDGYVAPSAEELAARYPPTQFNMQVQVDKATNTIRVVTAKESGRPDSDSRAVDSLIRADSDFGRILQQALDVVEYHGKLMIE